MRGFCDQAPQLKLVGNFQKLFRTLLGTITHGFFRNGIERITECLAPEGERALFMSSKWSVCQFPNDSPSNLFSKLANSLSGARGTSFRRANVTCPVKSGSPGSLLKAAT